ncbi:MAG: glutamine synthetase, partial [Lachnospiraceae bacterium]|nr:glutamine synthetase [Lachnospiraceae bacterium]
MYTGRTLLGARPPKGQELDDHYFGCLKPKVSAFMKELDEELWKLGVYAKTKHNEVAPAQHELAPIYSTANIATDHNQLAMEMMKSVADRHGLACLLHEKPFAGVNGSGKHNNWSLSSDLGANLLEPGNTPHENAQFLLFLVAVVKAVDEYQDLIRVSAASAGNDHRLGANEAPPAIVSIFLGEELTEILEALESGTDYQSNEKQSMEIGVTVLPHFPKDSTDRNRTSPFAFTGNKFEFRMLGSAFSIAGPNIILNTAVAEVLEQFADILEKADQENFAANLSSLIKNTYKKHKRIIFNGNNYADEWIAEAERRGLSNLRTTVDALPKFTSDKAIKLFTKHHVFAESEIHSRYEILLEGYCKTIHIEALTMIDMVKREIIPSCIDYQNDLANLLSQKKNLSGFDTKLEEYVLGKISALTSCMLKKLSVLEETVIGSKEDMEILEQAVYYRDKVNSAMCEVRLNVDELETLTAKKHWPLPTYAEILFSVI